MGRLSLFLFLVLISPSVWGKSEINVRDPKAVAALLDFLAKDSETNTNLAAQQNKAFSALFEVLAYTRMKYYNVSVDKPILDLAGPESPNLAKLLKEKIRSKHESLRARAVYSMGVTHNLDFGQDIYDRLNQDPSPTVRMAGAAALCAFTPRLMDDNYAEMRRGIVDLLTALNKKENNPDFTRSILESLNNIGPIGFESAPLFLDQVKNLSPDVRAEAVKGLGNLNQRPFLETIREMIDDPNERVASRAVRALLSVNGPNAVNEFIALLQKDNEAVRAAAVRTLGDLYRPETGWNPLENPDLAIARKSVEEALTRYIGSYPDDQKVNAARQALLMIKHLNKIAK